MAYPTPFVKLTLGGTIAGEDIWSNTLSLAPEDGESADVLFEELEPADFATAASTFYRGAANGMAAYQNLTYIKLAEIGVDGKTIGEPKIYDYPAAIVGNYNGSVIPQASIVVSLMTAAVRGLANRGRIYLPAGFGDVATTTGRLTTATTDAIAARSVTFFDAINTLAQAVSIPGNLAVLSSVREGASRTITGVEVGNLVDTQRRRRNRLTEVYVDASLTT